MKLTYKPICGPIDTITSSERTKITQEKEGFNVVEYGQYSKKKYIYTIPYKQITKMEDA